MKKNAGVTLVELITVLGVATVMLTAVAILATYTFDIFDHSDKVSQATDDYEVLQATLRSKEQCSANLKDFVVKMTDKNTGVPVAKLNSFDANQKVSSVLLVTGKKDRGLEVKSILIKPVAKIEDTLTYANLEITFEKSASSQAGFKDIVRKVPLMIRTNNNKITECWSRRDSGDLDANQICTKITNGVYNVFDVDSGQCKLGNGEWFDGDRTSASCPPGTFLPKFASDSFCSTAMPPGFVDTFPDTVIQLSDGSTSKTGRSPVLNHLSNGACLCDWAADLPASASAGAKCRILCVKP